MEEDSAIISLKDITFSYDGSHNVLNGLNLLIKRNAFTSILGPSGSGKSTLLKMLSGFLTPSSGTLEIMGNVSLIFQDYALFPHLTVLQNILYGLKLQKRPATIKRAAYKEQLLKQANQMARILGITDLLKRYPNELSGGQQQRVALARALVLKTDVILMDEPLSSLDEKLRIRLREELRALQKHLSLTIVYVTHDRGEALAMSDEIAVLNDGVITQSGSPRDLYFHSADRFTASFVGGANFLEDKTRNKTIMVRPEWVRFCDGDKAQYKGVVIGKVFCGSSVLYKVQLPNNVITVEAPCIDREYNAGDEVSLVTFYECVL